MKTENAFHVMTASELVERIARMTLYKFPEHESWTDDQAEDAIVTMNRLIEIARALTPDSLK